MGNKIEAKIEDTRKSEVAKAGKKKTENGRIRRRKSAAEKEI
jgi:hypothetical protein